MVFESNSSCPVAPKPFGNTAPLGPQIWSLLLGSTATGAFGNHNSSPLGSTSVSSASSSSAFGASTSAFGTSSTTAFGSPSSPFGGRPTQDNQSAGGAASLFGQSSANPFTSPSSLFDSTSSTSRLFSTTGSSTFGTSKSLFGTSMGNSLSLPCSQLSIPSLPPSSCSFFGQNASTFGQDTSSFGQNALNAPSSDSFRYLFSSVPSLGHTNELSLDSGSGGMGMCDPKVSGTTVIALNTGKLILTANDGMGCDPDNLATRPGYEFAKDCWVVDGVFISVHGSEEAGKAIANGVRMDCEEDCPIEMRKIANWVRDKANRHDAICEFIVGGKLDDGNLELFHIRRPEDGFPYSVSKGNMFILGKGSEDAKTCVQKALGSDYSVINNWTRKQQMDLLHSALLCASNPEKATGGRFTCVAVDAVGNHMFAVSTPSNPSAEKVAERGYSGWQCSDVSAEKVAESGYSGWQCGDVAAVAF